MIKRLIIKNCLGITELALNPGKVNIISGGNEKGKTSILESIEKALFNTKRRARFVQIGAEKAYIELETDNGIDIRRTVKEDEAGLDTGSVKVTKDGVPIKAPETFLKELFGVTGKKGHDVFAFNPVDFMLKKDTEQTDILLALLPVFVTPENARQWFGEAPKVNYEKHGLQVLKDLEQWFYEARREANARVKATQDECEAVAKRLPDNYVLEDWTNINLGNLFGDISAAEEQNRDIEDCQKIIKSYPADLTSLNNRYALKEKEILENQDAQLDAIKEEIAKKKAAFQDQIAYIDAQIHELEKQKAALQADIKNLEETSLAEMKESLAKVVKAGLKNLAEKKAEDLTILERTKRTAEGFLELHSFIEIAPLKTKAIEAEHMKSFVPLAKEVGSLKNRLNKEEDTAKHYDDCVNAARMKPQELLAKTTLPVKGLGIDGRGIVTIGGLPLSNLSTAQQVKTCLEIARVLAQGNPLKLVTVDKIEHLDETVRAEFIKQIEEDLEFQYFITQVTDGELKIETK